MNERKKSLNKEYIRDLTGIGLMDKTPETKMVDLEL